MIKTRRVSRFQPYTRFSLLQRVQHFIFLISFSILGFTGLPQKYPGSPISLSIFEMLGGIEKTRLIHHYSAVVMIIMSLVHVLELGYSLIVLRTPITMIPWVNDLQHVYQDVLYYLGFRKHKAYYGRYSYAEKAEYLALIWGTVVMALTGFMMWNPITTLQLFPGEAIPAAKAAHGGEAVLAVLAIIIWHFYHVHIKMLNKSMFTGKLNRMEMEHEHPAELAAIDAGKTAKPIAPDILRKRRLMYTPFAMVSILVFSLAVYFLIGYENTAVAGRPLGETAKIFSPLPSPTPLPPTATVPAPEVPAVLTWDAYIGPLFQQKCNACHGASAMGGLNMTSYASALKGGASGPLWVSKNSASATLFKKQSAGGHPGQLSAAEIKQIQEWIDQGAPEK